MIAQASAGILGPLASQKKGGTMLHWRSKLVYLAVLAAIVIAATGGDFDGWTW